MEDARAAEAGIRAPVRASRARSERDVDGAYRELRASVARGLAQRLGSSDLAEDLTQDVFVDLLLAARSRPPSNTRAWLARVAQRHAADTIGSAVRERAARARLEASDRGAAGGLDDPDSRLALDECLARLPESQRRIVELRLLDGLSFAHCGLRLGLGEDAARMRFRRALDALRRELVRVGLAGD
ncbi:MAG TPA: sigma-70 family RNA polymerase sigma factor [Gaiellales bacterium]